jgi:hypothetical protein
VRNGKAGHSTRKAVNKAKREAKRDDMSAFLQGLAHVDVFPDAKAAWDDLVADAMLTNLTPKQLQDAKFIFMSGYQRAANLFIYCAGATQSIDIAADQATKDCMDYEQEARGVLAQRKCLTPLPPPAWQPSTSCRGRCAISPTSTWPKSCSA